MPYHMRYTISTIWMIHILYYIDYIHSVFRDPYFKKLNIQNLSWRRSLASAKKQSWILSNFELSVIDFLSWLQILKSNTWRRKRNSISSMNYFNDQWYPTAKEFIAVTILKLKNIALYLRIQKSNTPNKLTVNGSHFFRGKMIIYLLKSVSNWQVDGARFKHQYENISKALRPKVYRIHWFIRTYSRSLSSDRFWRFEGF